MISNALKEMINCVNHCTFMQLFNRGQEKELQNTETGGGGGILILHAEVADLGLIKVYFFDPCQLYFSDIIIYISLVL